MRKSSSKSHYRKIAEEEEAARPITENLQKKKSSIKAWQKNIAEGRRGHGSIHCRQLARNLYIHIKLTHPAHNHNIQPRRNWINVNQSGSRRDGWSNRASFGVLEMYMSLPWYPCAASLHHTAPWISPLTLGSRNLMIASKGRSWVVEASAAILPHSRHPWSIDRSMDFQFLWSPPSCLTEPKEKKRKILPRMAGFFENPWLQKILWLENLLVQKNPWSETSERWFLRKQNSSSRQISEEFLFFSKNFLRLLLPRRCCCWWDSRTRKKALGFSDLKTCQSKLGEFFFFFFWDFFGGLGFGGFLFLFLLDFFNFYFFSWVS